MDYTNAYEVMKWFCESAAAGFLTGFFIWLMEFAHEKEKNKLTL